MLPKPKNDKWKQEAKFLAPHQSCNPQERCILEETPTKIERNGDESGAKESKLVQLGHPIELAMTLYVINVVSLVDSWGRLQQYMDALQDFCTESGFTTNLGKPGKPK